jgi:hypothetical protein
MTTSSTSWWAAGSGDGSWSPVVWTASGFSRGGRRPRRPRAAGPGHTDQARGRRRLPTSTPARRRAERRRRSARAGDARLRRQIESSYLTMEADGHVHLANSAPHVLLAVVAVAAVPLPPIPPVGTDPEPAAGRGHTGRRARVDHVGDGAWWPQPTPRPQHAGGQDDRGSASQGDPTRSATLATIESRTVSRWRGRCRSLAPTSGDQVEPLASVVTVDAPGESGSNLSGHRRANCRDSPGLWSRPPSLPTTTKDAGRRFLVVVVESEGR